MTGVVVAFGAMFLLLAIIGGIVVALGYADANIAADQAVRAGIGAGIAFAVAQLLAYYWGGYTAGRMARGAGLGNGLAVPLFAILMALLVGGIVALLGGSANLNLPFAVNRLPIKENFTVDWGVGISIASLAAMFIGGALGGIAGSHWHTKLERKVYEEEQSAAIAQNEAKSRTDVVTTADRRVVATPPATATSTSETATSETGTTAHATPGDTTTGEGTPTRTIRS